MRSYRPEELFDDDGRLVPELAALAPEGDRRMGANPHANGGRLTVDLDLPDFRDYAIPVDEAGHRAARIDPPARQDDARHVQAEREAEATSGSSAPTRRTRTGWATSSRSRTAARSARSSRSTTTSSPDGRVMEVLSEHLCQGWLEGYVLTGRHGLFATYEAFAMVSASMTVQHTKWLEEAVDAALAQARPVAEHPADLDLLAQRPQRLQPPGAGPDRHGLSPRRGRWPASTCRRTPTACCRWPTTASAAGTTST